MKKKNQPNKPRQKERGEKLVSGFITILKFLGNTQNLMSENEYVIVSCNTGI